MIERYNDKKPQVILAALETDTTDHFEHRLEEMNSLIDACDMEVAVEVTQRLHHPEAATYIGSGKAKEIAEAVKLTEAEYCIFEDNLSPAQLKNLTNLIGIPVWDRTTLILEIFSRRAQTREARLQVESAYLQYMLPRLSGMWQHLGRQGGGGGSRANKGVGETQLELDRRHIKQRISELEKELDLIGRTRTTQREGRIRGGLPRAALVGYTNAGKSTLMNQMLAAMGSAEEKQVLQKDMLFATLDTSIRRINVDGNRDFLLSDTVGFIENLPHGLIKAFRSTLEEAVYADLILVVLDASDDFCREHRKVTEDTLIALGADKIPRIYVMNKADLVPEVSDRLPLIRNARGLYSAQTNRDSIPSYGTGFKREEPGEYIEQEIWMAAEHGIGLKELTGMITSTLYRQNRLLTLLLPYERGDLLNRLHQEADVREEEYLNEGVKVTADCPAGLASLVEPYMCE